MLCKRCEVKNANRPRGLCWHCYYAPGVRDGYPADSNFAVRGVEDFNGRAPLPRRLTSFPPGSPGKVEAMRERAGEGRSLFHPQDATREGHHATATD